MIIYGNEISNDQFKYCDQKNHEYTDILSKKGGGRFLILIMSQYTVKSCAGARPPSTPILDKHFKTACPPLMSVGTSYITSTCFFLVP